MPPGRFFELEGVEDCADCMDCMRLRGFVWPRAPPKVLEDEAKTSEVGVSEFTYCNC